MNEAARLAVLSRIEDAERRERVLALTDQVMSEQALSSWSGPWRPTAAAIEQLLNDAFGPAEIAGWRVLEPWSVLRASGFPVRRRR